MATRWERARRDVIARSGGALVTALLRTTRHELIAGHEVQETIVHHRLPVIYLLWHGRLLPCSWVYRDFGFATLISRNRDGDYITGVIEDWGYTVLRGSTSRGAATAQLAILRTLHEGTAVALTPDGPRGPRQKMKLGPLRAAQKAGVPVVPLSASASSAWFFGRWDRFLVPKPFARIPVALGSPIELPKDIGPEEMEARAEVIERELNRLTALVDDAARA